MPASPRPASRSRTTSWSWRSGEWAGKVESLSCGRRVPGTSGPASILSPPGAPASPCPAEPRRGARRCVNNTFGIAGVAEHTNFFKSLEDATRLRLRISECFERAALPQTTEEVRGCGASAASAVPLGECGCERRRHLPPTLSVCPCCAGAQAPAVHCDRGRRAHGRGGGSRAARPDC